MKINHKAAEAVILAEAIAPGIIDTLDKMFTPKGKDYDPWSTIQLSKSERRGKTYEEINALRKAKWEAMKNEEINSKNKQQE